MLIRQKFYYVLSEILLAQCVYHHSIFSAIHSADHVTHKIVIPITVLPNSNDKLLSGNWCRAFAELEKETE